MELPKFVVFNSLSNQKYLRPGGKNRYMKFEVEDVERWGVKHEVLKAKCEVRLVHIRCCDTGKYWSWGLTEDSKHFITAQADQPCEKTTTGVCTLIKPSYNTKGGVNVINLQVMYEGKWWSVGGNSGGYLVDAGDEDFIISNCESMSPNDQLHGLSVSDEKTKAEGTGASSGNEEMALPKFVVFNSFLNKKYLCLEGATSYMKFKAVNVVSWGVKHEVQMAKSGGGLVHIKCCDTGKYWSWGLTDYSKSYITAQTNQPEEDTALRACTLIKPSQYTKDGVRVVNLEVMYEGNWWSIGTDGGGYLVDAGGEDFIISNWELLPRDASTWNEEMDLPKFVVFNSLSNKKYLRPGGKNRYMKFEVDNVERWGVKHEIQRAKYEAGLFHIRNCDTGKYWTWGLTEDSKHYITSQADQPWEDTTTRGCTLIKLSRNTKDGFNVVNLQVMDQEKWWSVGGYKGRYLVDKGVEDFIISSWESLSPDQAQGPSVGDKNIETGGTDASIGNEEMALPNFEEGMDLPKFVVFNSLMNKNYLCPEGTNSYMKFEAVDFVSCGVKHEVQKAKSGGGLVHIRCCETGKYWSWGLTDYSKSYIVAQANQPGEDITTRSCTLIKPSQYTKDGVRVVNLEVMYEGNWWSIGTDGGGYLVDAGGEDFIISNWDVLAPKQLEGPSDGDENLNTGGGVLIGHTSIEGGVSIENSSGNVSVGNTILYLFGTPTPELVHHLGAQPELVHQLGAQLSEVVCRLGNMNTRCGVSTEEHKH